LPVSALVLAVAALVLSTGSVPHAHVAPEVGLWNHEHDLSVLAALGLGAPLPDPPLALACVVAVTSVLLAACTLPTAIHRRQSDSRAPPLV
jgi:hypothetical protein